MAKYPSATCSNAFGWIMLFFILFPSIRGDALPPKDVPLSEKEWNACITFIKKRGPSLFSNGQTYLTPNPDLPYPIEKDPETGNMYLHLIGNHSVVIGRGGQKTVTKSILLGAKPKVVACFHCSTNPFQTEEVDILRRTKGVRGIMQFQAFLHNSNTVIVEYFNKRNLKTFLRDDKPVFTNSQLISIFQDLIIGLQNLHALGLVHRDIKIKNILIHQTKQSLKAALADFGQAYEIKNHSEPFFIYCPSCPPECLLKGSRLVDPFKAETYALGLCLYYLMREQNPSWFQSFNEFQVSSYSSEERVQKFQTIIQLYNETRSSMHEKGIRKQLMHLVLHLLHPDCNKRITLNEAIQQLSVLHSKDRANGKP